MNYQQNAHELLKKSAIFVLLIAFGVSVLPVLTQAAENTPLKPVVSFEAEQTGQLEVEVKLIEDNVQELMADINVRVFDASPLSCADIADGTSGDGASSAYFDVIYMSCTDPIDSATTNVEGKAYFDLDAGIYVVIAAYDLNENGIIDPDDIFMGQHLFLDDDDETIKLCLNNCATVAFAYHSLALQPHSVATGNVGAASASEQPHLRYGAELSLAPQSKVIGSAYGDSIAIKNHASVLGNVIFNELFLHEHSNLGGLEISPLPLPTADPSPVFPSTIDSGTENVVVSIFESKILAPGQYADVVVQNKSDLILEGGVYTFENLLLFGNNRVIFQKPSIVKINDQLISNTRVYIGPEYESNLTAGDITFFVKGVSEMDAETLYDMNAKGTVTIGNHNLIQASIFAPNSLFTFKSHTRARGVFVGKWLMVHPHTTLTLECGTTIFVPEPPMEDEENDERRPGGKLGRFDDDNDERAGIGYGRDKDKHPGKGHPNFDDFPGGDKKDRDHVDEEADDDKPGKGNQDRDDKEDDKENKPGKGKGRNNKPVQANGRG